MTPALSAPRAWHGEAFDAALEAVLHTPRLRLEPQRPEHAEGLYPLLLDETCFFLAVDFDKSGWQDDASAFLSACHRLGVPAALERSRSGRGGHVWLFFDDALPAALVRRLGSHLLTEAMEGRPDIGLDSYDRLFPNQDTLPQGGFGNLIALPLQKRARDQGNSPFQPLHVGLPCPGAGRSNSSARRRVQGLLLAKSSVGIGRPFSRMIVATRAMTAPNRNAANTS